MDNQACSTANPTLLQDVSSHKCLEGEWQKGDQEAAGLQELQPNQTACSGGLYNRREWEKMR